MSFLGTLKNYLLLSKPSSVLLLAFTALAAMIVAKGWELSLSKSIITLFSISLGSAGSNAITCYFDRDIDRIMERTSHRPLPSGKINPATKAMYFGLFLIILSLVFMIIVNLLASLLLMIGIFDNIIIYSKILKRRNPINIILGGFSGGFPVLVGYAAVNNGILDIVAFLMAGLVVLWIPTHIWSLALRWKEDYRRARIPMLPVVTKQSIAIRCIGCTSILLTIFALYPYFLGVFSLRYLIVTSVLSTIMLILNAKLLITPSLKNSWIVFKFSSPFLALIMLVMIFDVLF